MARCMHSLKILRSLALHSMVRKFLYNFEITDFVIATFIHGICYIFLQVKEAKILLKNVAKKLRTFANVYVCNLICNIKNVFASQNSGVIEGLINARGKLPPLNMKRIFCFIQTSGFLPFFFCLSPN